MLNKIFENNGVNGTGTPCECPSPSRCSPAQQWGPGCHPVTARVKWNKELNKIVMECFYRSKSFDEEAEPIREYRKRVSLLMRKQNLLGNTERECLESGEKG